jgi:hypothetical protein
MAALRSFEIESITDECGAIWHRTSYGIVSPSALQEMRAWVSDCVWSESSDDPDFVWNLSPATVIRGIARAFDGGIEGFLRTL